MFTLIAAVVVVGVLYFFYECKVVVPRLRKKDTDELKASFIALSAAIDLVQQLTDQEPERLRCCKNNCIRAVSMLLSGDLRTAYDQYFSVRADFFGLVERSHLKYPVRNTEQFPDWLLEGAHRLSLIQNKLVEFGACGTYQSGVSLCASKHLANAWAYLLLQEPEGCKRHEKEVLNLLAG